MLRLQVAAMQDFQRGEKLVAEIGLAAADAGERRGRAQHRPVAAERAVVRLDAPDRGDDVAVDAVLLLDLVEDGLVLGEDLAAAGDARVAHQDVEIIPERLGELRLRIDQVHDAQIGRQPCGVFLEARARDVALGGQRPQPFDAGFEIGGGLRGWRSPASRGWPEEPDLPVHSFGGAGAGAAAGAAGRRLRRRGAGGVAGWPTGIGGSEPVGLRQAWTGRAEQQHAAERQRRRANASTSHVADLEQAARQRFMSSALCPYPIIGPYWAKIWLSER